MTEEEKSKLIAFIGSHIKSAKIYLISIIISCFIGFIVLIIALIVSVVGKEDYKQFAIFTIIMIITGFLCIFYWHYFMIPRKWIYFLNMLIFLMLSGLGLIALLAGLIVGKYSHSILGLAFFIVGGKHGLDKFGECKFLRSFTNIELQEIYKENKQQPTTKN